jgi:hypothetical protein
MKIIGKNSLSQYLSYFLFIVFVTLTLKFVYEIIGYSVSYYNLQTGDHILPDFFIIGTDVGWTHNQWTSPMDTLMKFKFLIPFTNQNLLTGLFNTGSVIYNILNGLFLILFFYSSYGFFREISKEQVFNAYSLLWLKRFGWLNIVFSCIMTAFMLQNSDHLFYGSYYFISFLFFGALILFLVEFFKKGLELQNQADLTI